MTTGDAAVLGRLFSHLHSKEQIDSFLSAVQEIRQARIEQALATAAENVLAVAVPPAVSAARESRERARAEAGLESLSGGSAGAQEQMGEIIEKMFAYDPEDEADNWWVQWGLVAERMGRWNLSSALEITVEENQDEESE